jgi:hypothetical protein
MLGLERLEQQLQRVQQLMRKEALLLMAALCQVAGCLSCEQLALSAVLCMPTPCSLAGLSEAVSRQVQQRRQQQLQHQAQRATLAAAQAAAAEAAGPGVTHDELRVRGLWAGCVTQHTLAKWLFAC